MSGGERRSPVQPGDPAPDFDLPLASGSGSVLLAQYRGKSPVYLALFRGLYCSFCRRQIVMLGSIAPKLEAAGVRTVGVVATDPERARFYFRFRPPGMVMGADPELVTHRAYGLPNLAFTRELFGTVGMAAARELRRLNIEQPVDPLTAFAKLDGYELSQLDQADLKGHQMQLAGQFLIDRDGIVRCTYIECEREGPPGFGDMPTEAEILAGVQAL
jgi:peroxiredoxin